MFNENGAITTSCKLDKRLYMQVYGKNFIVIAAICGGAAIGLGLEIFFKATSSDAYDLFMLICFGVLLGLGAFLLILNCIAIAKSGSSQKVFECEIYAEFMKVSLLDNGRKTAEVKVDYRSITKRAETKNFFIAYVNKGSFHPIGKDGLTPAECNAVRRLLHLNYKPADGAPAMPASAFSETSETAEPSELSASVAAKPEVTQNIFEEFPDNSNCNSDVSDSDND